MDKRGNGYVWALDQAVDLLISSRYVIAITGAGVSVESGIPPFRGPGGLWTKHGEPPMDVYQRFLADPKGYWEERLKAPNEIVQALAQAQPNAGHSAMVELEQIGILRHLITQNIDNLHRAAGHQKLAEIHGNAQLLRCIGCASVSQRKRWSSCSTTCPPLPDLSWHRQSRHSALRGTYPAGGAGSVLSRDAPGRLHARGRYVGAGIPAASFPQMVKQHGGVLIEANLYDTPLTPLADCSLQGPFGEILPTLVEQVRAKLTA